MRAKSFTTEVKFNPFNTADAHTVTFALAPDQHELQNLISDLMNVGLHVEYSEENQSLDIKDKAHRIQDDVDARIARVLYQHGAIDQDKLVKAEDVFIRSFMNTLIHECGPDFKDMHKDFILEKLMVYGNNCPFYRNNNLTLAKEIADTLKSNNTPLNDFPDHWTFPATMVKQSAKTFVSIIEDRYACESRMQQVVTLANQKAKWQALICQITPEEIKEVKDEQVKQGLEITCKAPLEAAFNIVDSVHPEFPKIKISETLLNSYIDRIEKERTAQNSSAQSPGI